MLLLGNCRQGMMSLSLLVGMTVNIFTVYIYKHMFESLMSERSTLPESFLNKMYVRQDPGCQGVYCLRVFMYVCMYSMFAGYPSVTDYRK